MRQNSPMYKINILEGHRIGFDMALRADGKSRVLLQWLGWGGSRAR